MSKAAESTTARPAPCDVTGTISLPAPLLVVLRASEHIKASPNPCDITGSREHHNSHAPSYVTGIRMHQTQTCPSGCHCHQSSSQPASLYVMSYALKAPQPVLSLVMSKVPEHVKASPALCDVRSTRDATEPAPLLEASQAPDHITTSPTPSDVKSTGTHYIHSSPFDVRL